MTKIKIKDFQSIGEAELEVDGFTVVVGRNNIGKSALIRAIDSALTNATGNKFIRKKQKSAEVSIQRGDLLVVWKKGDSSVYTVNGENFSKLNRAIPKPLSDAGFGKIDVGDFKLNPTVAHQFQEIFLLDETGSAITEILASLYDLDVISKADDLCQKELKGSKSIAKTRELDLKEVKDKLVKYAGFEALKAEAESIVLAEKETEKLQAEIARLLQIEKLFNDLSVKVNKLSAISQVGIPDVSEPEELSKVAANLRVMETKLTTLVGTVKKLSSISSVGIPDVDECAKLVHAVDTLKDLTAKLDAVKKTVTTLSSVSTVEIPEVIDLESEITALNSFAVLEKDFVAVAKGFKETRDKLQALTKDLSTAETELAGFTSCPTCERPF